MTQPKEEVTMRDTSLDIHCARCGGVKGCPGIYHPAERAKLEALFQQKLEEEREKIREYIGSEDCEICGHSRACYETLGGRK